MAMSMGPCNIVEIVYIVDQEGLWFLLYESCTVLVMAWNLFISSKKND